MDKVELAVLTSRFEAICRAMTNTLLRSGRSGVLNTARDFSCCVLTPSNELLASGESLPIHVMSGPDLMAASMQEFHPQLRSGDAFLHNSPYHGCSHAADQSVLVPVVDDDGIHRFTVLAKAHQADIGNSLPTTYMASARDVYEEGALLFPAVQVQRDREDVEDVIRMCRMRIRVPEQWWGDYLAALGAARIGERKLLQLGAEVGWGQLEAYAEGWFAYSEDRMRAAIRAMPSGELTVHARHDPLPGVPDGVPVTASVRVRPEEERIEVDLRDNVDSVPCGLNVSEACSRTAAMIGVYNSLGPDVPANGGAFRRLEVLLREGAVLGIQRHPTCCSVSTTNVSDRLANAVQRGLAGLRDGIGMAEAGLVHPPSMAVISGNDPTDGVDAPFVNQIFLAFTGGPGNPWTDGWLTMCHVGNAGLLLRDSVEVDEGRFPILVEQQQVLIDTEGAGRRRGAPSAIVEYGPLRGSMQVIFAADGVQHAPAGARGGTSGGAAAQSRRSRDGTLEALEQWATLELVAGERIVGTTTGGGGYGPPEAREPDRVAHDVAEGLVSPMRAHDVYRVALDETGSVDVARTAALRAHTA